MRPYPKHFDFFLKLAKKMKLSEPEGRALYMVNRSRNGDCTNPYFYLHHSSHNMRHISKADFLSEWKDRLRSIREDTAKRWLKHWHSGGSLRMISLSQDQWLARRKKLDKERETRRVAIKSWLDGRGPYPR
jgi:hypothetical protein